MMWQDLVIMIANVIFSYALIPQVYRGFKTKKGIIELQTSLLTAMGLFAMAIALFTLKLYLSTLMVFTSAILWIILLFQKIVYK